MSMAEYDVDFLRETYLGASRNVSHFMVLVALQPRDPATRYFLAQAEEHMATIATVLRACNLEPDPEWVVAPAAGDRQ